MPAPTSSLTGRQAAIFEYIVACVERDGCQPSLREIGEEFGITSPNGVYCHLLALERKGLIRGSGGASRGLTLVGVRFVAVREESELADAPGRP